MAQLSGAMTVLLGFPADMTGAENREVAQLMHDFAAQPAMRTLLAAREVVALVATIKAKVHPAVQKALVGLVSMSTIEHAYDCAVDVLVENVSALKAKQLRDLSSFPFSYPQLQDAVVDVRTPFPEDATEWATRKVAEALTYWQQCKRMTVNEAIEAIALIRVYLGLHDFFHTGFEATFFSRQQIDRVYHKAVRSLS